MIYKLSLLLSAGLASHLQGAPPRGWLEPDGKEFQGVLQGIQARFDARGVWIGPPGEGRIHIGFPGGRQPEPAGYGLLRGVSNYYDVTPPRVSVPHYRGAAFRGVFPGIDIVFYSNAGELEFDILVAPGGDPARAKLAVSPARSVRRTSSGGVAIETPGGTLRMRRPFAYQIAGGEQVPRQSTFQVDGSIISVAVAGYDKRLPLVIDPVLTYASLLGGTGDDTITGIAARPGGGPVVTGVTTSTDFPGAPAGGSGRRGFIAALNPALNGALDFITFLGGARPSAIATGTDGSIYSTGAVDTGDLPAAPGFQPAAGGNGDAFLVKLNASGAVVNASYLGGSQLDFATSIAVDGAGNAYIAGATHSADFPVQNAFQPVKGGATSPFALPTPNGFVTKVQATGQGLVYSTFLGGAGPSGDLVQAIAADTQGNAYITGVTSSSNFPVLNPFRASLSLSQSPNSRDAFVTKFGAGGGLAYSTFLGGTGADTGAGIAVDSGGGAYVTGETQSTDFPTISALQPVLAGARNAFLTKLAPSGSALVYSTYLGAVMDQGIAVQVDAVGSAYVAGTARSTGSFTTGGFQPFNAGSLPALTDKSDAFVAKVSASGASLSYASYLGGMDESAKVPGERLGGLALDGTGAVFLAGTTYSATFPLVASNLTAYPGTPPSLSGDGIGTSNGFIARIADSPNCAFTVSSSDGIFAPEGGSGSVQITASPATCGWVAGSDSFISIGGSRGGTGNASRTITVSPNTAPAPRIGQLRVGDQSVPVQQDGASCATSVSPRQFAVPPSGGQENVTITAPAGCAWIASSDANWIGLSATAAAGSGVVSFTAAASPQGGSRTGVFSIAGRLITVTQGNVSCDVNAGPATAAIPSGGGQASLNVTAGAGCSWTATSNRNWITARTVPGGAPGPFPAAGSGPGSLVYEAPANTGTARWARVTVGAGSQRVTQDGIPFKLGAFQAGVWLLDRNGNYAWDGAAIDRILTFTYGAGEVPVTGDWNGSGTTKIGVYLNGNWRLDYNGNGVWDGPEVDKEFFFGGPGQTPYVGDWNGSGWTKIAVHQNGTWLIDYNGNFSWDGPGADRLLYFGGPGFTPYVGDWSGSGTSKLAVHLNGTWLVDYNGNFVWDGPGTDRLLYFGGPGFTPVIGDWNGDGAFELAAYQNGLWIVDFNGNFTWDGLVSDRLVFFGGATFTPVAGDWIGDGRWRVGAYDSGQWVLDRNGSYAWDGSTLDVLTFIGGPGHTPLSGGWAQ